MPTNNFKLFDENKANLLSDTEYANATQRLNGVQTGVASSQLNNKFAYQVSLVAYAIAQIMNQNGLDASDTLAVSAFVGNLQSAILQKVADKATSAEAAAGVLSNKYITPETMKAAALLLSGGVMNGVLDMGNNRIMNLGTPTANSDAVTKGYVDGKTAFKKKLIFDETVNAPARTNTTIMNTSVSYDEGVDLKGIIIKINNSGKARDIRLTSSLNGFITICSSVEYNSQITSTLMFGFFSEIYDDINSPSVLTVGYTVANYYRLMPFFVVPKNKSSNYYTHISPDGDLNSNVKIWGLF